MMPHRSDPTSGRDLPEGLYALPVGDGLAWLPREIPRTCWQCRHCQQAYTAETPGILQFWAGHHPSVCPARGEASHGRGGAPPAGGRDPAGAGPS